MEAFYQEVYGGELEGNELRLCLRGAEDILQCYERNFLVTEAVKDGRKLALCAMADAIGWFAAAQNGQAGLRYASVGTVSVSGKGVYQAMDISPKAQERELYRCAGRYLKIYRGLLC